MRETESVNETAKEIKIEIVSEIEFSRENSGQERERR
jgi:hypothetical protein